MTEDVSKAIMGYSLDEARVEIRQRWANKELRQEVERFLGNRMIPDMRNEPVAVLWRHLATPDNPHFFFEYSAAYLGLRSVGWENRGEKFLVMNDEKKGLGRLRLLFPDGSKRTVDIIDFHANDRRCMDEVELKWNERLVDFHNRLYRKYAHCCYADRTHWFSSLGKARDYYPYLMAHFVAHGVYFHDFTIEASAKRLEDPFMCDVIEPAVTLIKSTFGVLPLTVRLYPTNQTKEEDFYWWSYPREINDFLVEEVSKHNLPSKVLRISPSLQKNDKVCLK